MILSLGNSVERVKPLVSVIVPTCNRASLLKEALESIYGQEGLGEEFDIEVVVVDDASSDTTREVVHRFEDVRYIRHDTNCGVAAARNTGIKASTGKYLAFLDDDDRWLPNRLIKYVSVLEANPEITVLDGQNIVEGDGETKLYPEAKSAPSGSVFHSLLIDNFMQIDNFMVRRKDFQKVGYFDEQLQAEEDYDMWLRFSFHFPFTFIQGPVAIQRFSCQGQAISNMAKESYAETHLQIIERALAMLPTTEEYAEIRRETYASLFLRIVRAYVRTGDMGRMRSHILTALKTYSWMSTKPYVWDLILPAASRVACALAYASDLPIVAVTDFCQEIKRTANGHKIKERVGMRRLAAQILITVGGSLMEAPSHEQLRTSLWIWIHAIFQDPLLLLKKHVWKKPIKLMVSSRHKYDTIIIF